MEANYIKAMFGIHAVHAPVQMLLQDMGEDKGFHKTLAATFISTPTRLVAAGYPHELIVGDMVVRPFGRWASTKFRGYGIAGLVTSEAMFPEGHEIQTLDNGWEAIKARMNK